MATCWSTWNWRPIPARARKMSWVACAEPSCNCGTAGSAVTLWPALAWRVAGIMKLPQGLVIAAPNLSGWAGFNVRNRIRKEMDAPFTLENDANAAALGEQWMGVARNVKHLAFLTLGTGIGGGLNPERRDLARGQGDGRRAGPHQHSAGGAFVQLRQPWLPGSLCIGNGRGAVRYGTGGFRPGQPGTGATGPRGGDCHRRSGPPACPPGG